MFCILHICIRNSEFWNIPSALHGGWWLLYGAHVWRQTIDIYNYLIFTSFDIQHVVHIVSFNRFRLGCSIPGSEWKRQQMPNKRTKKKKTTPDWNREIQNTEKKIICNVHRDAYPIEPIHHSPNAIYSLYDAQCKMQARKAITKENPMNIFIWFDSCVFISQFFFFLLLQLFRSFVHCFVWVPVCPQWIGWWCIVQSNTH